MIKRRKHMARTVTAAAAIFATAFVGGTLQAALSSDSALNSADRPLMIHEAGVARFATTDTGVARFITTDTPRSPVLRGLQKLGLFRGKDAPLVISEETIRDVQEVGVATVNTADDGSRTLTIQTPSEWVFDLRNE